MMRWHRFAARLIVAAAVAALPGAGHAAPAPVEATLVGAPARVLVMLKQPPGHDRTGSTYGGAYGDGASRAARSRIGRQIARRHLIVFVEDWPMPLLGLDCLVMTAGDGRSAEALAAELEREPGVAWAQPVGSFTPLGSPAVYNDPLFPAEPAARLWRLRELHQLSTGRNVSVAVIDSGVDRNHPDLAGQVVQSIDFVGNGPPPPEAHGTGVAGVIAAKANNRVGIVGIAPDARIVALRACAARPPGGEQCDTLSLARALHYAVEQGVPIVNMSLGGPPDRLLAELIDLAVARGISVVAAVDPRARAVSFPASHRGVIAVGGVTQANMAAGAVRAPGQDIPTTQPGGRWYLVNGSSFAAAHVSGLLALLRARRIGGPAAARALASAAPRSAAGLLDPVALLSHASGCRGACRAAP